MTKLPRLPKRSVQAATCIAVLGLATLVAAPTAQSAGTTTITFKVAGCNGCTIGVQRAIESGNPHGIQPATPDYWSGPKAKVRNGRVVLRVPTDYTAGMSFTIAAPWEGGTGFVSNIVLGSRVPTGSTVTPAQQLATRRATACWAGTTKPTATIKVSIARVLVQGYEAKATAASAWASPTVATVGPMSRSVKGILGNQEAFYC